MALPRGINSNGSFRRSHLSWPGFYLLSGIAIVIFAGVFLLPMHARNIELQYRLKCEQINIENARETINALDEFTRAAGDNEILLSRLGTSRIGLYPANEIIVLDTHEGSENPVSLQVSPPDYPPPPSGWITRYGKTVSRPATRRGLLVMAACLVIAAMLIFPPADHKEMPFSTWRP